MSPRKTWIGARRVSLWIGLPVVVLCFGLGVAARSVLQPAAWFAPRQDSKILAESPTHNRIEPPITASVRLPARPAHSSQTPTPPTDLGGPRNAAVPEPATKLELNVPDEKADTRQRLDKQSAAKRRARSTARSKRHQRGDPKPAVAGTQTGPLEQLPIVGPVVGLILPGS
jgi:hypothetical protein